MQYTYKMEKVLDYRSNVEKSKVEDYTKISHKLDDETTHLINLEEKLSERKRDKAHDVNTMRMQFLYMEKLRGEVSQQKKKVEDISNKATDARGVLIDARKDRKIMEILKEKDRDAFKREILNKEQKEMDDITIMRYAK